MICLYIHHDNILYKNPIFSLKKLNSIDLKILNNLIKYQWIRNSEINSKKIIFKNIDQILDIIDRMNNGREVIIFLKKIN